MVAALGLSGLLLSSACDKGGADAKKDPAAPSSAATGSASAGSLASSQTAPPKPAPPPTYKAQKIDGGEHSLTGIYKLSNGIAVANANKKKVGHLTDKGVEWLDKVMPASIPGLGEAHLQAVRGSWPDNIYVQYSSSEGRAPQPTLWPLTGKGSAFKVGEGGGTAYINGFVEYGQSTIVSSTALIGGIQYRTIRGPGVPLITTKAKAEGCDVDKLLMPWAFMDNPPAMSPGGLAVTEAGTFIAAGSHCNQEAPYAEIWKGKGQGKLIDLSQWTKSVSSPKLIAGKGDEMFIQPDSSDAHLILRYKDGVFSKLATLRWMVVEAFGSSDGELIIFDGKALRKLSGDKWTIMAYLEGDNERLSDLIMHEGKLYGDNGDVVRFVPSESQIEHADDCKPLLYMYSASYKNDDTFTYPSTRKAISSFAGAKDVELIEFKSKYRKHVAVAIKSEEQGEALIKHLKTAMPKEQPHIVCYEPKDKRVIPLTR